ncbi:antitoxin VbhA family protein [Pseudonocardia sp. EC080625-04]|uniref:antitoxin VbhA family protein n=1 Tax=Pseudonocardia sp. EC080625-04 TaxID=1096868 RepID=UPI0039C9D030
MARSQGPVEVAYRRADTQEILASVSAQGLEPSPEGLAVLDEVVDGTLTTTRARERALDR